MTDSGKSAAGERAWSLFADDLLSGVAHALSNRAAALTAVAQLLASTTSGPLTDALTRESGRLQEVVELMRLLVRRREDDVEPIEIPAVLHDAGRLVRHHPALRDLALRVDADPGIAPVWGERSSLVHAFCALLVAAAGEGEAELRVRCSGDGTETRVHVPLSAEPASALDPWIARPLLELAGGTVEAEGEAGERALVVRLPTLMEVRRREREAASGGAPPAGG